MSDPLGAEYARTLAALEGLEFQLEVSARLEGVILGFQTVPSRPQGDGGLDAISHNGEHAYCCYGPEHNAFTNTRAREAAIVRKFADDLQRLFELEAKGTRLLPRPNAALPTILPHGQRIRHIRLIVNAFDSHRIIGPLLTKANAYRQASACQFVDRDATVVIQGPQELANLYPLSELTLDRAQHRVFRKRVQETAATVTIEDTRTFDRKMGVLREIRPDQVAAIESLASGLRDAWRTALSFDLTLSNSVPTLHEALDNDRRLILARVAALMVASSTPWRELDRATDIAKDILRDDFKQYGTLLEAVATGEMARLIGECTIDWRPAA